MSSSHQIEDEDVSGRTALHEEENEAPAGVPLPAPSTRSGSTTSSLASSSDEPNRPRHYAVPIPQSTTRQQRASVLASCSSDNIDGARPILTREASTDVAAAAPSHDAQGTSEVQNRPTPRNMEELVRRKLLMASAGGSNRHLRSSRRNLLRSASERSIYSQNLHVEDSQLSTANASSAAVSVASSTNFPSNSAAVNTNTNTADQELKRQIRSEGDASGTSLTASNISYSQTHPTGAVSAYSANSRASRPGAVNIEGPNAATEESPPNQTHPPTILSGRRLAGASGRNDFYTVEARVVREEENDPDFYQQKKLELLEKERTIQQKEAWLNERMQQLRAWEEQLLLQSKQSSTTPSTVPPRHNPDLTPRPPPQIVAAQVVRVLESSREIHISAPIRDTSDSVDGDRRGFLVQRRLPSLRGLFSSTTPADAPTDNVHSKEAKHNPIIPEEEEFFQRQVEKNMSTNTRRRLNLDWKQASEDLGSGPMRFALLPEKERSLEEQLLSLSERDRRAYKRLKQKLEDHQSKPMTSSYHKKRQRDFVVSFTVEWELRFLRYYITRDGSSFDVDNAFRQMIKLKNRYVKLNILYMGAQIQTKTLFPVPGLRTKDGHPMFYMRPSRYVPGETSTQTIIDNLVYVMNTMLEEEDAQVRGIGFLACMDDWKMRNFEVSYCLQFMKTLQAYKVPVKVQLFMIVNPPAWFGVIWRIMKPMLAPSFRRRVKICQESKISKYLQNDFDQYLPDDMNTGRVPTDQLVSDFVRYRSYVEDNSSTCGKDSSHHSWEDFFENSSGRNSLGPNFSSTGDEQDDASIDCDIDQEDELDEEDLKPVARSRRKQTNELPPSVSPQKLPEIAEPGLAPTVSPKQPVERTIDSEIPRTIPYDTESTDEMSVITENFDFSLASPTPSHLPLNPHERMISPQLTLASSSRSQYKPPRPLQDDQPSTDDDKPTTRASYRPPLPLEDIHSNGAVCHDVRETASEDLVLNRSGINDSLHGDGSHLPPRVSRSRQSDHAHGDSSCTHSSSGVQDVLGSCTEHAGALHRDPNDIHLHSSSGVGNESGSGSEHSDALIRDPNVSHPESSLGVENEPGRYCGHSDALDGNPNDTCSPSSEGRSGFRAGGHIQIAPCPSKTNWLRGKSEEHPHKQTGSSSIWNGHALETRAETVQPTLPHNAGKSVPNPRMRQGEISWIVPTISTPAVVEERNMQLTSTDGDESIKDESMNATRNAVTSASASHTSRVSSQKTLEHESSSQPDNLQAHESDDFSDHSFEDEDSLADRPLVHQTKTGTREKRAQRALKNPHSLKNKEEITNSDDPSVMSEYSAALGGIPTDFFEEEPPLAIASQEDAPLEIDLDASIRRYVPSRRRLPCEGTGKNPVIEGLDISSDEEDSLTDQSNHGHAHKIARRRAGNWPSRLMINVEDSESLENSGNRTDAPDSGSPSRRSFRAPDSILENESFDEPEAFSNKSSSNLELRSLSKMEGPQRIPRSRRRTQENSTSKPPPRRQQQSLQDDEDSQDSEYSDALADGRTAPKMTRLNDHSYEDESDSLADRSYTYAMSHEIHDTAARKPTKIAQAPMTRNEEQRDQSENPVLTATVTPLDAYQKLKSSSSLGRGSAKHSNLASGPQRFLIPHRERDLESQLANLSLSNQRAYKNLCRRWKEYCRKQRAYGSRGNPVIEYVPVLWVLRFLHFTASKRGEFQYDEAFRMMMKTMTTDRYLFLRINPMRNQLLTKTLFPVPGLKTCHGHDMFYMRPSRYIPKEHQRRDVINNLVYVMNTMLERGSSQEEGIGFLACMDDWKMSNFERHYCSQFMMALQGSLVPVKVELFLIVNPPVWFGTIWKLMRPMLGRQLRRKVKICKEEEMGKYLQDDYLSYLPDDMVSGFVPTDELVSDFVDYRRWVERGDAGLEDEQGDFMSESFRLPLSSMMKEVPVSGSGLSSGDNSGLSDEDMDASIRVDINASYDETLEEDNPP